MARKSFGLALVGMAFAAIPACSPAADPPPETPGDAGMDALPRTPPLPSVCETTPAETVLQSAFTNDYTPRLRALGETFYLQLNDGIHATTFPNGADHLLVPALRLPKSPDDAQEVAAAFDDFWIDDGRFIAVLGESVYAAPLSGGAPQLILGTAPATRADVFRAGNYLRNGNDIYHASGATRPGWPGYALRRASLSGSEWTDLLPPGSVGPSNIQMDDRFIYYFSQPGTGDTQALFRTPLDQLAPEELKAGLIQPNFAAASESLYLAERNADEKEAGGPLFRARRDLTMEMVSLPPGVRGWDGQNYPNPQLKQGAVFDGGLYLVLMARYRYPDDLRGTYRPVVVRVDLQTNVAALAACPPDLPIDPLVPRTRFRTMSNDIITTDAGVFLSYVRRDTSNFQESTHIVRVNP
jgi:hypothetical protein